MTLSSRHRIRNSSTLRSEAEHATSRSQRLLAISNIYEWARKTHFVSLTLECQGGVRARDLRLSKQAALTTAPGPPAFMLNISLSDAALNDTDCDRSPDCSRILKLSNSADLKSKQILPFDFSEYYRPRLRQWHGSTYHWTSVGLMLVHRLRRWPNIKPTRS